MPIRKKDDPNELPVPPPPGGLTPDNPLSQRDRRLMFVGRRKGGYCGHVPQFLALSKKTESEAPPDGSSNKFAAARRLPSASTPSPSGAVFETGDHRDLGIVLKPIKMSHDEISNRPPPPVPHIDDITKTPQMWPAHRTPPKRPESAIKLISGYGGHRAHAQFRSGTSVNSFARRSEDAELAWRAMHKDNWLSSSRIRIGSLFGPEPLKQLPRYPVIRGPTRINPLGHDCFLSN